MNCVGVGVLVVGEVESLSLSCGFWGTEEVDAGAERSNEEDEGCTESSS